MLVVVSHKEEVRKRRCTWQILDDQCREEDYKTWNMMNSMCCLR